MKERYPFFRDEDEETKAVIGEDVIDADLNGAFEKPYAVLTQKRMYTKNWQGNFLVEVGDLTETKEVDTSKTANALLAVVVFAALGLALSIFSALQILRLASLPLLLQILPAIMKQSPIMGLSMVGILGVPFCAVGLVGFAIFRKKDEKKAEICAAVSAVAILSPLAIGFLIGYFVRKKKAVWAFLVVHANGEFSFNKKDYPAEELEGFARQVAALKEGGEGGK